jgi:predicted nucleotide-binding protein
VARRGEKPEGEPLLRVPRSQLDAEIGRQLELGEQISSQEVHSWDELKQLESQVDTWDEFNEELLRRRFTTGKVADDYRRVVLSSDSNPTRREKWLRGSLAEQIRRLKSVREKLPLIESEVEEADVTVSSPAPQTSRIFLVHGHDDARKLEVAQFLQRGTGEWPIILHEPADKGRTIIEKFEDHASEAGFAVILLTADDVGREKSATDLNPRARQNVVFEFGFFVAKLGRAHVVALTEKGVERPSDIDGVLYKTFDGNWHTELAKEIRAADIKFEL